MYSIPIGGFAMTNPDVRFTARHFGGYSVYLGCVYIGEITGRGFSPSTEERIGSMELGLIALKIDEVSRWGDRPHVCPECGCTPFFPAILTSLGDGASVVCSNLFHKKELV